MKEDIIILDAITGSQITTLSGHLGGVGCLTLSLDGKSLVSGGMRGPINLWDVQTGGITKTFYGHTGAVWSVCISADCTMIVSGSYDHTTRLWDIQTQECLCVIEQQGSVNFVSFSPTDSQHIISISCDEVWHWDINGHQIPPIYDGIHIAFSPDHTQFALCNKRVVTV